jgi:hypothetical protein
MKTAIPTARPIRASHIPACLDLADQESHPHTTNQGFFNSLLVLDPMIIGSTIEIAARAGFRRLTWLRR